MMRQLRGTTKVVFTNGMRVGVDRTTITSMDGNKTATPFVLVSPEGASRIEKNRLYGGSIVLEGGNILVYGEDGLLDLYSPPVEEEYEGNYILTIEGFGLYEPAETLEINRFQLLGPIEYLYFQKDR